MLLESARTELARGGRAAAVRGRAGGGGLGVGGVATPLVYGWVLDAGGSRWMYWMTAGIMALAIAAVISTRRRASDTLA